MKLSVKYWYTLGSLKLVESITRHETVVGSLKNTSSFFLAVLFLAMASFKGRKLTLGFLIVSALKASLNNEVDKCNTIGHFAACLSLALQYAEKNKVTSTDEDIKLFKSIQILDRSVITNY